MNDIRPQFLEQLPCPQHRAGVALVRSVQVERADAECLELFLHRPVVRAIENWTARNENWTENKRRNQAARVRRLF